MMKKLMVITAALLAGTAIAAAQGMNQGAGSQGGGAGMGNRSEGSSPAPAQQRGAPAEKMDKGEQSKGAPSSPSQTTGQAQRDSAPKADDKRPGSAQMNKSDDKPGTASQRSTMDNKPGDANKAAADKNDKPGANRAAQDNKPGDNNRAAGSQDRNQTTGQGAAGSRAAVNLSSEQQTKIRTVVKEKVKVQPITNVNFSISVGTRVPRDVRYVAVPQEIVTIYPQWSGYYIVNANGQILIIEPSSFEIVYIIA